MVAVVMVMALAVAGCGKKAESSEKSKSVSVSSESMDGKNVVNPIQEVQSAGDLADIGGHMEAPKGAENVKYSIIDSTIAQVSFTLDGTEFAYRGGAPMDNMAGIYSEMMDGEEILEASSGDKKAEVTIGSIMDGGFVAGWKYDKYEYSLAVTTGMDGDAFEKVVQELADSSLS